MMGAKISAENSWWVRPPFDSGDFGRCHRLLKLMPEWRERLHEVSDQLPEWKPYVDSWGKLTDLYLKCGRTGNYQPLFNRMDALKDKSRIIYQSRQQGAGMEIERASNP